MAQEIQFSGEELEDIEGLINRLSQYGTPKQGEILSNVDFRRRDSRELILTAIERAGLKEAIAVDIKHKPKKLPERSESEEFVDPCSTC